MRQNQIVTRWITLCTVAAAFELLTGPARAASQADKCMAAKSKVAGKYYFCRQKAEAKSILTGDPADYGKCSSKFEEKWDLAESKSKDGLCPDNVAPTSSMNAYLATQAAETAAIIAGTMVTPSCGDDVINDAGEQCDGTDLGGTSCTTLGFIGGTLACGATCVIDTSTCTKPATPLKTGQTKSYGPGSDGDLEKGASRSYTDNGDGTITDDATGLMWEKKSDDDSIHDKDNAYSWGMTSTPYTMNGTMVTSFLADLNGGGGFAGHTDWRIPNVNELLSLVYYGNAIEIGGIPPAVDEAFNSCFPGCTITSCSCTNAGSVGFGGGYWSSTTMIMPDSAYILNVSFGAAFFDTKGDPNLVRAVRGGS